MLPCCDENPCQQLWDSRLCRTPGQIRSMEAMIDDAPIDAVVLQAQPNGGQAATGSTGRWLVVIRIFPAPSLSGVGQRCKFNVSAVGKAQWVLTNQQLLAGDGRKHRKSLDPVPPTVDRLSRWYYCGSNELHAQPGKKSEKPISLWIQCCHWQLIDDVQICSRSCHFNVTWKILEGDIMI